MNIIVMQAEVAAIKNGNVLVVYEDGTSSGYIPAVEGEYHVGDEVFVCDDVILGKRKED